MATAKQIAAARRNIKKAQAANKGGSHHGKARKNPSRKRSGASGRSARTVTIHIGR